MSGAGAEEKREGAYNGRPWCCCLLPVCAVCRAAVSLGSITAANSMSHAEVIAHCPIAAVLKPSLPSGPAPIGLLYFRVEHLELNEPNSYFYTVIKCGPHWIR